MASPFHERLQSAQAGDPNSLQQLLAPHLPGLAAFLRMQSGGVLTAKESVDDLVQTVCRRAIDNIGGVRSDDSAQFRNWLFTLALSAVNDKLAYHGAKKRDARREVDVVDTRVSEGALLGAYGQLATPSRQAIAREELARIETAIAALPAEYREVLALAAFAELPRAEIGARMGRSEDAVRQLLARARARLARLLNSDE